MKENEIILYQPNDAIHLEVRMAEETVWLTQQQNCGNGVATIKVEAREGVLNEEVGFR